MKVRTPSASHFHVPECETHPLAPGSINQSCVRDDKQKKWNVGEKGSYFDGLLHEEHSDKQSKQLPSNTREPIDDGTSSTYSHHKQHQSSPNTDPTHTHSNRVVSTHMITLLKQKLNKEDSYHPDQAKKRSRPSSDLAFAKLNMNVYIITVGSATPSISSG